MPKPKSCKECKYCEISESNELECTQDMDLILSGQDNFINFLCPKGYNNKDDVVFVMKQSFV